MTISNEYPSQLDCDDTNRSIANSTNTNNTVDKWQQLAINLRCKVESFNEDQLMNELLHLCSFYEPFERESVNMLRAAKRSLVSSTNSDVQRSFDDELDKDDLESIAEYVRNCQLADKKRETNAVAVDDENWRKYRCKYSFAFNDNCELKHDDNHQSTATIGDKVVLIETNRNDQLTTTSCDVQYNFWNDVEW